MNLEFIPDGSWEGEPLLVFYGGPRTEVPLFQDVIRTLAAEPGRRVSIDMLAFIRVIDSVSLTAVSDTADQGVVTVGPGRFEWRLSSAGWTQVHELLDVFNLNEPGAGFQFLNPPGAGGADVIYSRRRAW